MCLLHCTQTGAKGLIALLQGFTGHRDIVSGLAFRGGTHELCSASFDRSVKVWSLDDRTAMDTLLGHQAEVLAIDMLRQVC